MAEFCMPSLGADMVAGTIIEWMVKPGDPIRRGDIIAVVDTEKATIEVEVFMTGTIESILVPVGEKVPVGTALALIRDGEVTAAPGEISKPLRPEPGRPEVAKPVTVAPATARPTAPITPVTRPAVALPKHEIGPAAAKRLRISPVAMRMALEMQVDLSKVEGTGPGGAIGKADIERALKFAEPAPASAAVTVPSPPVTAEAAIVAQPSIRPALAPAERKLAMRRAIAAAMARSKREIPHYYLGTRIDMSNALAWLQAENLKRSVNERLLYSVLLLKAVALAARQIPEMNGFWIDNQFKPGEAIHVGVAISSRQGGLIAPAIHDVDKKNLNEIMSSLRELVKRVRAGILRSSEIADATITVTSLGEQGVESVFGVIYPPQVALAGFGKIAEHPWAVNGMLGVRPIIMASLAADHRASDGHRGGLFLATINSLLQEPQTL
jgi:pyruvate dehydrogenase E2 component (dihydrolipoamide acetyltransferase)